MGYILYGILGIFLVVLCILIEDNRQLFKIIGMIGVFSGNSIIILGYISGVIIKEKIYFMNTDSIIRIISHKFYMIGFIGIVIGIMGYLMYFVMNIIIKIGMKKELINNSSI